MVKAFFIVLLCVISSFTVCAQTFSTERVSKKDSLLINETEELVSATANLKASDTFDFKLDSVYVNVEYNSRRIVTNNLFIKSNKSLTIYYYFKNDSLKYVESVEKNLIQPGQATSSKYYFEKEQIVNEIHQGPSRIVSMCIAYSSQDIANLLNYRRVFETTFLKDYIIRSLKIIKEKVNQMEIN